MVACHSSVLGFPGSSQCFLRFCSGVFLILSKGFFRSSFIPPLFLASSPALLDTSPPPALSFSFHSCRPLSRASLYVCVCVCLSLSLSLSLFPMSRYAPSNLHARLRLDYHRLGNLGVGGPCLCLLHRRRRSPSRKGVRPLGAVTSKVWGDVTEIRVKLVSPAVERQLARRRASFPPH